MASRPRRNFPKVVIERDTDSEGEDSSSGEEEDVVEEADQIDEAKSEEEEEVANGHEEDSYLPELVLVFEQVSPFLQSLQQWFSSPAFFSPPAWCSHL